ncbi:hypothetical protein Tco_0378322 [Tanacetum coccineum]
MKLLVPLALLYTYLDVITLTIFSQSLDLHYGSLDHKVVTRIAKLAILDVTPLCYLFCGVGVRIGWEVLERSGLVESGVLRTDWDVLALGCVPCDNGVVVTDGLLSRGASYGVWVVGFGFALQVSQTGAWVDCCARWSCVPGFEFWLSAVGDVVLGGLGIGLSSYQSWGCGIVGFCRGSVVGGERKFKLRWGCSTGEVTVLEVVSVVCGLVLASVVVVSGYAWGDSVLGAWLCAEFADVCYLELKSRPCVVAVGVEEDGCGVVFVGSSEAAAGTESGIVVVVRGLHRVLMGGALRVMTFVVLADRSDRLIGMVGVNVLSHAPEFAFGVGVVVLWEVVAGKFVIEAFRMCGYVSCGLCVGLQEGFGFLVLGFVAVVGFVQGGCCLDGRGWTVVFECGRDDGRILMVPDNCGFCVGLCGLFGLFGSYVAPWLGADKEFMGSVGVVCRGLAYFGFDTCRAGWGWEIGLGVGLGQIVWVLLFILDGGGVLLYFGVDVADWIVGSYCVYAVCLGGCVVAGRVVVGSVTVGVVGVYRVEGELTVSVWGMLCGAVEWGDGVVSEESVLGGCGCHGGCVGGVLGWLDVVSWLICLVGGCCGARALGGWSCGLGIGCVYRVVSGFEVRGAMEVFGTFEHCVFRGFGGGGG